MKLLLTSFLYWEKHTINKVKQNLKVSLSNKITFFYILRISNTYIVIILINLQLMFLRNLILNSDISYRKVLVQSIDFENFVLRDIKKNLMFNTSTAMIFLKLLKKQKICLILLCLTLLYLNLMTELLVSEKSF